MSFLYKIYNETLLVFCQFPAEYRKSIDLSSIKKLQFPNPTEMFSNNKHLRIHVEDVSSD